MSEGWLFNPSGNHKGVEGVGFSLRVIRRSTITLALRMDTSRSTGCRCSGIDTRSMGPMAILGEFTEYLSFGARGLLVCRFRIGPGLDSIGSHEGTSYRTRLRSKCRICREPTPDIGMWLRTRIDCMSILE